MVSMAVQNMNTIHPPHHGGIEETLFEPSWIHHPNPETMASSTLPSCPPPMPRRQSCDRCHDQKVRCLIADGPDAIFTPGGTADDQVSLTGHFVSDFPCKRCKKAGATCIFSPQLRSGRPRIPRDSNSTPASRKRGTATSSSPSCPPLSPASSMLTSSPPPSISSPGPSIPPDDRNFGYVGQGAFHFGQPESVSDTMMLSSPGMAPPLSALDSNVRDSGVGYYGPTSSFDPWLFSVGSERPLATSSYPASPLGSGLYPTAPADASLFSTYPHPSSHIDSASYAWDFSQSSVPATDAYYGDLAEIDRRIQRSVRRTPLSSSLVYEVIEASFSLVRLVDRRVGSASFGLNPHSHTFSSREPVAQRSTAADASFRLLVLECHKTILGVFNKFIGSVLGRAQSGCAATVPPQIEITANIIARLVTQLDRAIGSLPLGRGFSAVQNLGFRPADMKGAGQDTRHARDGIFGTTVRRIDKRRMRLRARLRILAILMA
ncbi:hypothetical protein QBC47DRAFT_418347 [Echria macrotheca]|uniref:Zn(2)-C6 fungal-type domain-containing protein n=1 Tax=Echria macrotheca TaxID=438768 RepID=A0AAJ0B276_9PEZI|nr:hypothetical protein QBC47DRAFT_418347 [Echria macrotheca]